MKLHVPSVQDVQTVYFCVSVRSVLFDIPPYLLGALSDGETKRPHACGVTGKLQDTEDAHQLDDLEHLADFTDPLHGLQVFLCADVF